MVRYVSEAGFLKLLQFYHHAEESGNKTLTNVDKVDIRFACHLLQCYQCHF
jgi:hypothetical protein